MQRSFFATALAVGAVSLSVFSGLAAPSLADDGDPLDRARDLISERKPREALAILSSLKPQEASPSFHALKGESLMDLGRFPEAKLELEKAQKDSVQADYAKVRLAHIEFLYGHDEKAAALLASVAKEDRLAKSLGFLMKGPFAEKWGDAARACRVRSKDGHYLVQCDIGMDDATAAAINAKAKPIRAKGGKDVDARLDKALPTLESANAVARLMDLIYKAYGKVFQLPKDESLVHRVYVFAKRDDFLAFSKGIGEDMSTALGFFDPETRILAVDATPAKNEEALVPEEAVNTLFHEGLHQFIHYYVPDMPSWFNEGLAEYFGPSQLVSKTELTIGVVDKRYRRAGESITRLEHLKGAFSGEYKPAPMGLKQFLTADGKDFAKGERAGVNYAQAWSFVHYLLSTEKGKKIVKVYFKALREGRGEKAAFAEAFGKEDLNAMEDDWKDYVKRL